MIRELKHRCMGITVTRLQAASRSRANGSNNPGLGFRV